MAVPRIASWFDRLPAPRAAPPSPDGAPMTRTAEDLRRVLLAQGAYYAATGVAPFVSRRLFEALTGPKREWWLVQTVGGLVTVIGGALLAGAARGEAAPELLGVAVGSAATLAGIDVVYVSRRRISPIYLVDAGAELGLIAAIAASLRRPG
jgi:hypothetical protein